MKEGWKYKTLGEVCYKITDGSHNPPRGIMESQYIMLSSQNVQNGFLDYTQVRYLSKELFEIEDKRTQASKGDVLLTIVGTIGRSCVLTEQDTNITFQRSVAILKPTDQILSYFLQYALRSQNEKLNQEAHGAAQKGIYLKQLSKIQIPVPPLSEQQRIVSYLDTSFAKIDALAKQAEESLENAKALFQATLKELMEKKEGWEEKKLGEIASDSADGPFGSNLKKEHYTSERQVRIIQLSNIGEEGWREDNTKYTTFEHLKIISRSEVEPNDIVIAKMMPAGRAIICPNHERKFVLSSDAVKVKLKKGYHTKFILYSINSPYFRSEVYENVTGSGRVRTSLTKLRDCILLIPPFEEQERIANTLDTLSEKVAQLQSNYTQTLANCQALKQALLRETFE